MPHISSFFKMSLCLVFTIYSSILLGYSQNMPVPENIQSALLPKVLKFSPEISSKTKIKMLIVYDNNSISSKNAFVK